MNRQKYFERAKDDPRGQLRRAHSVKTLLLGLTWLLVAGMPVGATTFTVDRTDDVIASGCNDGVPNDCSLRGAIIAANGGGGGDIINLPAGTYGLAIVGRCEDAAATGDLDITAHVTIVGAGAPTTIIDANGIDRVFDVAADLDLQGVTIRNGDARSMTCTPDGGGIFSAPAPPTTTAVQLTLTDVAISGNRAAHGGGIDNESGSTLTVEGVTLNGNSADLAGGGMQNIATPAGATLTNATVSANLAGTGAGIHNEGELTLTSVTMSGNTLDDIGERTIRDTIVAGSAANTNCTGSGTTLTEDHNLDSGNTCGFGDATDLTATDPSLGPLQDNGGPTQTHALLSGSPAIDAGDPACPPPAMDQRGTSRPQPAGGRCDIGAYEFVPGTAMPSTTTTVVPPSVTTTTAPCTSARCTLETGLASAVCAGGSIPAGVTKKFDRALNFIDQSASSSGKQATRLLKRAKRTLKQAKARATRAAKGKKAKISAECAAALKGAADQVASGLGV
jgi:hypothetical protein